MKWTGHKSVQKPANTLGGFFGKSQKDLDGTQGASCSCRPRVVCQDEDKVGSSPQDGEWDGHKQLGRVSRGLSHNTRGEQSRPGMAARLKQILKARRKLVVMKQIHGSRSMWSKARPSSAQGGTEDPELTWGPWSGCGSHVGWVRATKTC